MIATTVGPTFSAVIVARDEEALIRKCLESVLWCDERILLDMESRDQTRARAQGLATRIVDQPWIPHMEFARNRGIALATGDWILVVDADETIPPKLAERLQARVAADPDAAGIWIPRMNHCFGRPVPHVGGFPDYQLRCIRRGAGRYPDRLHSHPEIAGRVVHMPVEDGAWILHDRDASIGDLVRKWDEYAEKEALARVRDGEPFAGPLAVLWAGLSAFRFRFFTAGGWKDGMPGLVLSVLFAFYRFEVEAKVWQARGYAPAWDGEVRRLGSLPRLAAALARYGLGRWRRAPREGGRAP
jgi:glycosyltransferase involved in cell wall biosynthesis